MEPQCVKHVFYSLKFILRLILKHFLNVSGCENANEQIGSRNVLCVVFGGLTAVLRVPQ